VVITDGKGNKAEATDYYSLTDDGNLEKHVDKINFSDIVHRHNSIKTTFPRWESVFVFR